MVKMAVTWLPNEVPVAACAADSFYPDGKAVDLSGVARRFCVVDLECPAPGIGIWRIECSKCGIRVGLTAAGRADDVRKVRIPCYAQTIGTTGVPDHGDAAVPVCS